MPDVVTFDGPNKIIQEISASGDNALDIVEIYSEWKDWVRTGDNSKFLPAFTVVGGDPISSTQNLGSTFFLENGWRIRPAELNHRFELVGNLYTREEGGDPVVDTVGTFRVTVVLTVSNLTDSSVARLDLDQVLQAIYIDPSNGTPGTADTVGTPTNPSSNIADARTIADSRNLFGYEFRGALTVGSDHTDWFFNGLSAVHSNILNISGVSVTNSRFRDLVLTGSILGTVECENCRLEVITGLDGTFKSCELDSTLTIANSAEVVMVDCSSNVPGDFTPVLTMGVNSQVNIRNYSGGIEIRGMTAGCVVSIDLDPGTLILSDSSNTGGTLLVRGVGKCVIGDNVGTTVNDDGLLDTIETYTALQAIVGNATRSADQLVVEIKDKDNTTVLRALNISSNGNVRSIA